jgi:hypothetical protein
MMITPLVRLAAARIPSLTDLFSDTLTLTSMVVNQGGSTVLTTSAPHGVDVGTQIAIAIVDAFQPNAITDLDFVDGPGSDVLVSVAYPHALTTTPDATLYDSWDAFASMTGTGVLTLEGPVQLVSVPSRTTLVVRPATSLGSLPGTIPGAAALLERLERDIVGWRPVTAASPTTFTFLTPASVTRSYTVANPKACTNIRVWGGVDLQHVMRHYSRDDESDVPPAVLDQCFMFILPPRSVRLSRDRSTRSDAMVEITPTADIRQMLIDGFEIVIAMPAERYGGAVACVDRAHGPILSAVLRTFNGLRLYRPELAQPASDYVAFLTDHSTARYDRANYWHSYRFECPAQLTNGDCIPPIDIPVVDEIAVAIMNSPPGSPDIPTNPVQPVGTVPFTGVWFGPDPQYGIWQQDQPQPLVATFNTNP